MSGSRSVLESAVTSLEVNMYWLWEGRLLGASMVLVLWVWSLLFAALMSFLNFSFAGENGETKKNERCLHYANMVFAVLLWCFAGESVSGNSLFSLCIVTSMKK